MKTCSICQLCLPLSSFDVQSTGKLGHRADCKVCRKRFLHSKEGLAKSLYSAQRAKSVKRGHPAPAYSADDLLNWLQNQPNFKYLFDAWVNGGHKSELKPSVDRLDDYKPYTLDNIRVISWGEHNDRYHLDAIAGVNTKACVAVHQYHLDGTFIKTHHSYSCAARSVGGLVANIRNVAEGRLLTRKLPNGGIYRWMPTTSYGFIWKK